MSNPSLKIESYGTPSSLVPGSIYQNVRNNNLEILTIVQTIPANPNGSGNNNFDLSGISGSDLAGKEIVGSSAEFSFKVGTGQCSIGTNSNNDLLLADDYDAGNEILQATLSDPVPAGSSIKVYVGDGGTGTNAFTLTLRLILRKI